MGLQHNTGESVAFGKAPGLKQSQAEWRASRGIDTTNQIRLVELNHVRYRHANIGKIVQFLEDFGFELVARTDDKMYFRGYGRHHYDYVVEIGDQPKFLGGSFTVESLADLERATQLDNASPIQQLHDAPGGGQLVTILDPGGFPINLIFGQQRNEDLEPKAPPQLLLNGEKVKSRLGACQRFTRGPAAVYRVGHFGCCYKDFQVAWEWYLRNFNFVPSDIVYVGTEENHAVVASFLHIDRGEEFTDHHTFFLSESDNQRVHHCSFEVHDFDTQLLGHQWLERKGYKTVWGVGRHLLGSQIFDYWRDTSNFMIEVSMSSMKSPSPVLTTNQHYADGDLVNKDTPVMKIPATNDMMQIWGPNRPTEWMS
ncbi:uncharacterized protein APUU_80991A [Aspergillus puulaauensis]|uniref:VOC domain-containing protein n=1 Tax=Aspergillus puulaauensis TaxID=1220207 RepID=A0A7R7Y185_9EURO|nr:uncharacterized protein APUU_80991A [Aspergillus puulaauensis]BCS30688.1 hypothetical protein APUU_80991A [Aspergillus puulaauensis]